MTRALVLALAAALAVPAAAAPRHPHARHAAAAPAGARHATRHAMAVPKAAVDTVLTCFGFTGLADHAGGMADAYAAPPQATEPVDLRVRALVQATHTPKDLLASARRLVSTLPPPILKRAAAFCHGPAGRAYAAALNGETNPFHLKRSARPDAAHARLAQALVTRTHLAEDTRDENLLAVRNAAGARGFIRRAAEHPEDGVATRQAFAKTFEGQVAKGVQSKLGNRTEAMRQAVVRLIGMSLARTPTARVKAMVRFFHTRAGEAMVEAFGASLHAAMDDAWDRMARRFVTGKLAPPGQ